MLIDWPSEQWEAEPKGFSKLRSSEEGTVVT